MRINRFPAAPLSPEIDIIMGGTVQPAQDRHGPTMVRRGPRQWVFNAQRRATAEIYRNCIVLVRLQDTANLTTWPVDLANIFFTDRQEMAGGLHMVHAWTTEQEYLKALDMLSRIRGLSRRWSANKLELKLQRQAQQPQPLSFDEAVTKLAGCDARVHRYRNNYWGWTWFSRNGQLQATGRATPGIEIVEVPAQTGHLSTTFRGRQARILMTLGSTSNVEDTCWLRG